MSKTKPRPRWQPEAGAHMTPEMAREMIAEFDASGLSSAAFTRRHGLAKQRVSYWRSRLRELGLGDPLSRKARTAPAKRFAEV